MEAHCCGSDVIKAGPEKGDAKGCDPKMDPIPPAGGGGGGSKG